MEAAGVRDVASFVRAQAGGLEGETAPPAHPGRSRAREPEGVRHEGHPRPALRRGEEPEDPPPHRLEARPLRLHRLRQVRRRLPQRRELRRRDRRRGVRGARAGRPRRARRRRERPSARREAEAAVRELRRLLQRLRQLRDVASAPGRRGPYRSSRASRFGGRATFDADTHDGFLLVERDGLGRYGMVARMDGVRLAKARRRRRERPRDVLRRARFSAEIDLGDARRAARRRARRGRSTPNEGHRLALWRYHAMRLLLDGVLAGVNPVSARWLRASRRARASQARHRG